MAEKHDSQVNYGLENITMKWRQTKLEDQMSQPGLMNNTDK